MTKKKQYFTAKNLALVGLLAAMVFVFTYIGIDIPSPLGKTKLHMGNVMCLLAGLLFGPVTGGLSAGMGSAIYDLMDPAWAPEFWVTFINKFAMAFVAGLLARARLGGAHLRLWLAGVCGAVSYCALYVGKNILSGHFIQGFAWNVAVTETLAVKLPTTLVNALIAVVCSVLLCEALRPALRRAKVFDELL